MSSMPAVNSSPHAASKLIATFLSGVSQYIGIRLSPPKVTVHMATAAIRPQISTNLNKFRTFLLLSGSVSIKAFPSFHNVIIAGTFLTI
jgi:hypothetical protein